MPKKRQFQTFRLRFNDTARAKIGDSQHTANLTIWHDGNALGVSPLPPSSKEGLAGCREGLYIDLIDGVLTVLAYDRGADEPSRRLRLDPETKKWEG